MNLDFPESIKELQTERCVVTGLQAPIYAHVIEAGDPVSGGALNARQDGNQFTLRFLKKDYPSPAVHDKVKTTNYGDLRMKQRFNEGELWSVLCTGKVRGRHGV